MIGAIPREARQGLVDIAPVIVAAVPIGLLYGALAAAKGLSVLEIGLMSLLVFAGGSQFTAVELWTQPVPVATLVFSAMLINARMILMGASLGPKMAGFSWPQRLFGYHLLTDEAWALAERHAGRAKVTPAYWFGLTCLLPAAWVATSVIGAYAGSLMGDPRQLGADFAFTAMFIGLTAGFWKGRVSAATIAASAVASALVYVLAGPPWHVAAGAVAGIGGAYLAAPADDRA
ncbi:MAG: AzlC family ABC transporter permease [Ferrovibrionaceae bacterium]